MDFFIIPILVFHLSCISFQSMYCPNDILSVLLSHHSLGLEISLVEFFNSFFICISHCQLCVFCQKRYLILDRWNLYGTNCTYARIHKTLRAMSPKTGACLPCIAYISNGSHLNLFFSTNNGNYHHNLRSVVDSVVVVCCFC